MAAIIPFNEHLCISQALASDESAKEGLFRLKWKEAYANSSGSFHGGALMAFADAAMSRVLKARLPAGKRFSTLHMGSTFVASGAGDIGISVAIVKIGNRIAHCTASITAADGKLLFNATATFAIAAESRIGG